MDIAQSFGMGLIVRLCGYDYRIARHYPTRFVLQTICLAHVRRHDQTPSALIVEYPIPQTKKKIVLPPHSRARGTPQNAFLRFTREYRPPTKGVKIMRTENSTRTAISVERIH